MAQQISLQQQAMFFTNLDGKYNATLKNGYVLPARGSPCITNEYLDKVRAGTFFVPHLEGKHPHSKVVYKNPVNPPVKMKLFEILLTAANAKGLTLGFDQFKLPDRRWLVTAIGTLQPNHLIFHKDYKPEVKQKLACESLMVDNSDGFFTGLPIDYRKSKGKVRSLLPKEMVINHKILMEQQKAERAQERIQML